MLEACRRGIVKRSAIVIAVAFVLAKTLSTGSTSFRSKATDEFQVFNEIGRCENDIDLNVKGNGEIISDCVRKYLSTAMSEQEKKKIVDEVLSKSTHWSGAFRCKKNTVKEANAVCFNIVRGEKTLPSLALFKNEAGSLKVIAIKSEQ